MTVKKLGVLTCALPANKGESTCNMHDRSSLSRDIVWSRRFILQHRTDFSSTAQERPAIVDVHDPISVFEFQLLRVCPRTNDARCIDCVVKATKLCDSRLNETVDEFNTRDIARCEVDLSF